MTHLYDPLVRLPLLCAALERGEQGVYQDILKGNIPPHDRLISLKHSRGRAWRLSTIRAWDPLVADRCAAILHTIESFPLDAA
jgi:hypothetical protein